MSELEQNLQRYQVGQSAGKLQLSSLSEVRDISCAMAAQCKRSLQIFSYDLDALVYDQDLFLNAVKNLILHSPLARVEILLQDNRSVIHNGHRLVELMRRVSSKIEIRKPQKDYIGQLANMLIVDHVAYVYREHFERYDATADFYAPLSIKQACDFFKRVWEQSERDSELRQLNI
ncbi:MAG: hypothetical protein KZQ58_05910 [gamma proteobacterium symbiont of Bathyaustriella thionipta]|nr:hypothetical protein [gamma proteobacterium symbiont of Bathyaustriella thionipta]